MSVRAFFFKDMIVRFLRRRALYGRVSQASRRKVRAKICLARTLAQLEGVFPEES